MKETAKGKQTKPKGVTRKKSGEKLLTVAAEMSLEMVAEIDGAIERGEATSRSDFLRKLVGAWFTANADPITKGTLAIVSVLSKNAYEVLIIGLLRGALSVAAPQIQDYMAQCLAGYLTQDSEEAWKKLGMGPEEIKQKILQVMQEIPVMEELKTGMEQLKTGLTSA